MRHSTEVIYNSSGQDCEVREDIAGEDRREEWKKSRITAAGENDL